jgi:hypothetical protein
LLGVLQHFNAPRMGKPRNHYARLDPPLYQRLADLRNP